MFMAIEAFINVEVGYARPEQQLLCALKLPVGSCVEAAIYTSGILGKYPEIDLDQTKVGIFGSICSLEHILSEGDRVEIYRPLTLDPKAARRQRAKNNQN
jgi:uncharacterized protein